MCIWSNIFRYSIWLPIFATCKKCQNVFWHEHFLEGFAAKKSRTTERSRQMQCRLEGKREEEEEGASWHPLWIRKTTCAKGIKMLYMYRSYIWNCFYAVLKCSAHHVALDPVEGIVDCGSHQAGKHEAQSANEKLQIGRASATGHPFSQPAIVEEELTVKQGGTDHQWCSSIEFQSCWCSPGSIMDWVIDAFGNFPFLQPSLLQKCN